jgi:hypothetical protein
MVKCNGITGSLQLAIIKDAMVVADVLRPFYCGKGDWQLSLQERLNQHGGVYLRLMPHEHDE